MQCPVRCHDQYLQNEDMEFQTNIAYKRKILSNIATLLLKSYKCVIRKY